MGHIIQLITGSTEEGTLKHVPGRDRVSDFSQTHSLVAPVCHNVTMDQSHASLFALPGLNEKQEHLVLYEYAAK